ncbi:MAG: S8 family serine peptidase [Bacteroidales bacterium]|nr:S8 family serine peptidase [Bacteroidales bacterium]
MKKLIICLGALAMTFAVSCSKNEISDNLSASGKDAPTTDVPVEPVTSEKAMFIPGTAIVKFSEEMAVAIEKGVATKAMSSLPEELGMKIVERVFPDAGEYEERTRREGLHRFYLVEFDKALSFDKASTLISNMEGVDLVEPCRKAKTMAFDDPNLSRLWGFTGTYNIRVQDAWQYSVGDPNVVVCVVDEGIQQDHEDLKWNLYNDNYNFVNRNTNINAGDHGTHVSGTIAGVSNNGVGVAGIAGGDYKAKKRGVSLQSAQVFEGSRSAYSFGTAIKWGADHGAVISQNSWGYDFDWDGNGVLSGDELQSALTAEVSASDAAAMDYFTKYAGCDNAGNQKPGSPMKGGVVVFAAGNDGIKNGVPGKYPAAIAVGATTSAGVVASFSNWGDWVDICAPGQQIYSTVSGGKYSNMSGTSMACPHVSGACALLVSFFGGEGFTNDMLRDILISGANPSRINYNSHPTGPYLDLMGSINYGIEKFKKENNNAPEITTEYDGDFVFRQYQRVSIPFRISDPDGDNVLVSVDFEGKGDLIQDTDNPEIWNFTLIGELVSDFTPKNAVIKVKDIFGAEAEYKFTYQVLKNNAPKAVGKIDDMIIIGTGQQRKISLSGMFTDADGETLTVSAKDLVDAPAKLDLTGETLTLTTTSYGSSTITVSAVDGLREKATIKFKYLVRPQDVEMDFYPNPVRDYLHVRTGVNTEDATIVIESSTGNVLYNETQACSAFEPAQVNMKDFAPGMYVLRVTVGGKTYVNNIAKR